MKKKNLMICSVIAFCLLSNFAITQNIKKLSLDEFVKLGLENSKSLKIAFEKDLVMKAKVQQVKNQLLPNLTASTNYTRISDNIDPFKVKLNATAPEVILNPQILNQSYNKLGLQYGVFTGFRAINTLKSFEFLEKATAFDVEKEQSDIKLNLINSYYAFYKLILSKKVVEDNIKTIDNRLKDVKSFVNQNMALQNDVLKLELQKSNVAQNIADLNNNIDITNFNLDILIGLPTDTKIEFENATLDLNKIVESNDLINMALQNRPEILSGNFRKLAAEKNIAIAKGNYYPVVSIGAGYDYNLPNQRVFPQEEAFKGTWSAGITASLNLFNFFTTKALIQEQKANFNQVVDQQDQISDGIKMEVNANNANYSNAIQKIALAEQAISQATENQRIMKSRYNNQVATLTDLLEADFLFSQAQINLITAKVEAALNYSKLQKSIGK